MDSDPLKTSDPRRVSGWGPYKVIFSTDSAHYPINSQIPMKPVGGPETGSQVEPHPTSGYTASQNITAGPVGGMSAAPTEGKPFGSPMDARMYPAIPFTGRTDGPGTNPLTSPNRELPALGNTTTQTPGAGNLSPSGTGIHDQPSQAGKGSGSNLQPQESYHPAVSTRGPDSVASALKRFRERGTLQ